MIDENLREVRRRLKRSLADRQSSETISFIKFIGEIIDGGRYGCSHLMEESKSGVQEASSL